MWRHEPGSSWRRPKAGRTRRWPNGCAWTRTRSASGVDGGLRAPEQLTAAAEDAQASALSRCIVDLLVDGPRSGRPGDFTAEQILQIIAIACEDPEEEEASDRPVSHWTPREVADEAVKRQIVPRISVRSVGRFLKSDRS